MNKGFWGAIFVTLTLICNSFAQVDFQGDVRFKVDHWQWFRAPGFDDDYTYYSTLLRLRFLGDFAPRSKWLLEVGQAAVGGLPDNARAPGAQGSLGPGATLKSTNGDHKASLFIKQMYVDWNLAPWQLRVGRTDFTDGTELSVQDPNLAWLRQNRTAQRFLGRNGDSLTQRMYDGIRLQLGTENGMWTFFLAHPVEGANELDVTHSLTRINIGYLSFTQAHEDKQSSRAWRGFGNFYQDSRPVAKVDNSGGLSGAGDINLFTFGGDWTQVWKRSSGKTDLLVRAAAQIGDWGQQDHTGYSYGLEAGHQITKGWKPWLRLGYSSGSGDDNAADNKHRTWFPGLPGGRIHAATPFYNTMNLDDAFAMLMLTPGPAWNVHVEYHHVRLNRSQDRWYSGSGAFNNSDFGVSGRPSNGNRNLADVFDISITYKASKRFQVNIYKSWVKGGNVVRAIYPGDSMSLLLMEATWRF